MKTFKLQQIKRAIQFSGLASFCMLSGSFSHADAALIIDHNSTDISLIPVTAIEQAKADLHIAYGHTSHGSQLIYGMGRSSGTQLDDFLNNSSYYNSRISGIRSGLYTWNNEGTGDRLDLRDTPFSGASDLGNPNRTAWEAATRSYLDSHSEINTIIWSWCGQASTSIANIDIYLNLMEGLIADYPGVTFVFMTGHLDGHGKTGNLHLANEHIREHCRTHDRVLYDFADIETFDPDGVDYGDLHPNDNCDYDGGNWATSWQNSHVENVDWWASGAAHSQHLNGNRKGYAAWWLWASLAGWGDCTDAAENLNGVVDYSDLDNIKVNLSWNDISQDNDSYVVQRRPEGGSWTVLTEEPPLDGNATGYSDTSLAAGFYQYRVIAHLNDNGEGVPCDSASSVITVEVESSEAPSSPSALSGIINGNSINLSWVDNSDTEAGFQLQRNNGSDWTTLYEEDVPDLESYTDTDLAPGSYAYRVRAYNRFAVFSDFAVSQNLDILDVPDAPSGLSAMAGDTSMQLNWTDNSNNEVSFVVQRDSGSGWILDYATVAADVTDYTDSGLTDGTYTYRIVARNDDGDSAPSNEDIAVIAHEPPLAPSGLVSERNGYSVTLNWSDNSDNEENFLVERQIDDSAFSLVATLDPDIIDWTDPALAYPHEYTYRLQAINANGSSDYTNTVSEMILETEPDTVILQSTSTVSDTFIRQSAPTSNYGATQYVSGMVNDSIRYLVQFDMTPFIDKKIIEANMYLFAWGQQNWQPGNVLDVYQILQSWQDDTVTWDTACGCFWEDKVGEIEMWDLLDHDDGYSYNHAYYPPLNITDIVQQWADGEEDNNGLIVVNATSLSIGLKAIEYGTKPYFEITYTDKPSCSTDFEADGDVDGLDVAEFASQFNADCLDDFAAIYGR